MTCETATRNPGYAAGLILVAALWSAACIGAAATASQAGVASVYSDDLNGKRTASGEHYDTAALTAAHRSLPLGTEVKVTRLDNGKSVNVRINDRGPNVPGRIIDLSRRAATALGLRSGVARVRLDVESLPEVSRDAPSSH